MADLTLGLVFDTGPFPLKGTTSMPVKGVLEDPKSKSC